MSNKKPIFNAGDGKPIRKKFMANGVEEQHNELMTRHKKRKARKKKKRNKKR